MKFDYFNFITFILMWVMTITKALMAYVYRRRSPRKYFGKYVETKKR